jgi:carbonic anhydrase
LHLALFHSLLHSPGQNANSFPLSPEISLKEDLATLRASPFLGKDVNILGFKLDIETGLLTEVK